MYKCDKRKEKNTDRAGWDGDFIKSNSKHIGMHLCRNFNQRNDMQYAKKQKLHSNITVYHCSVLQADTGINVSLPWVSEAML